MENYILFSNTETRRNLTKLRISAHSLEIEIGRYTRPKTQISDRKCKLCTLDKIEDEYHMLLECPVYEKERLEFICNLKDISCITIKDDFDFFCDLMFLCSKDREISLAICTFINKCFSKRKGYTEL